MRSEARNPVRTFLFDTLDSVKKLEEAGVPQKQAEAQVRLFSKVLEESICSKQDLLETEGCLKVELKETEGRLEVKLKETEGRLEVKLRETEGRLEVKLRELEVKLKELEGRVLVEIEKSKSEIIKWFIGTFLASIGLIASIGTLLFKLIH